MDISVFEGVFGLKSEFS